MTPQQIENKIRELVPELLELSFGCRVILDGEVYDILYYDKGGKSFDGEVTEYIGESLVLYSDDGVVKMFGESDEEAFDYYMPNKDEIKIIGHPIHLEHLLLAIDRHSDTNDIDIPKICNLQEDTPYQAMFLVSKIIDYYDLTKSLSQNLQDSPKLTTLLSDVLDVI